MISAVSLAIAIDAPRVHVTGTGPLHVEPGLPGPDLAELAAGGAVEGRWAATAATLPGGDPGGLAAVREGRAAVQDEGSQLVALALAAVPVDGTGSTNGEASEIENAQAGRARPQRWLDLCAGPGGKAGLLAALARQQGAAFVANEVSEHRAELVRHTLRPALAAGGSGGSGSGGRGSGGRGAVEVLSLIHISEPTRPY